MIFVRLAISRMTRSHQNSISLAHDPQWNAFAGAPRSWESGAAGADNFVSGRWDQRPGAGPGAGLAAAGG